MLSSMILTRLKVLLDALVWRFEMATEDCSAPRGRVDWARYATRAMPQAQFLAIPCSFPELRADRLLKGAIRYTLEQQIRGLETQKGVGGFVHRLIEFAESLYQRARSVPLYVPTGTTLDAGSNGPCEARVFWMECRPSNGRWRNEVWRG